MIKDSNLNKKSFRILVVDDNIDAAETLSALLEMQGYYVQVAHDGIEALNDAVAFKPQVIFLDIAMPDMNGYETADALRRMPGFEDITIIALTGWDAESDRVKSGGTKFNHLLTKPVQVEKINELLSSLNFPK